MNNHDELIGRNLARLRLDVSQTELANRMRSLGHKWTQPTVVAIEKGERPLRMSEALDAASVLGVDLYDLVKYPAALDFFHQQLRAEESAGQLHAWAKRYEVEVRELVRKAKTYTEETGESIEHEMDSIVVVRDSPVNELASARAELAQYAARLAQDSALWPSLEPRKIDDDGQHSEASQR